MRKNLLKIGLSVFLLANCSAFSSPKGDMEFLGYSDDIMTETIQAIAANDETGCEDCTTESTSSSNEEVDEATSLKEQLVELANTRAIRADLSDKSLEIKGKIDGFWNKMNPQSENPGLSDELRSEILAGIREALTVNNYTVIQLELLDLPEGSNKDRFRAVVRATRPLATKNSYKEIQKNLLEIREICNAAATINGKTYLSELTTFVAENPKNKYYYEKTILKY